MYLHIASLMHVTVEAALVFLYLLCIVQHKAFHLLISMGIELIMQNALFYRKVGFPNDVPIVQIAAGEHHCLALARGNCYLNYMYEHAYHSMIIIIAFFFIVMTVVPT